MPAHQDQSLIPKVQVPADLAIQRNQELADWIFREMSRGCSMIQIAKTIDYDYAQLIMWITRNHKDEYRDAQKQRADYWVEMIMHEASLDFSKLEDRRFANAAVQAARLKVDAIKWIASKMRPDVYGDKLEIAGNKDHPISFEVVAYSAQKKSTG